MSIRRRGLHPASRGSALLAVLWLSAALGAIAFSVATTVRGETERVITNEEDVRATYLAQAAIQRAILHIQWAQTFPANGGLNPYYFPGQSRMFLSFPSGDTSVDLIPEASKIDLNTATPATLNNILLALGVDPDRAGTITGAIVDWRTPHPAAQPTALDQFYLSQQPSFAAPHASFKDVEELLFVAGMTPDLFYGTWVRQGEGANSRLVPRAALRDCVSVFGSSSGRFDPNTVEPAVLYASGAGPDEVQALVQRRQAGPFLNQQDLSDFAQGNPALLNHLSIAPHTIYTLRATARMRRPDGSLSDLKRSISALVKIMPAGSQRPFDILRWYDRG